MWQLSSPDLPVTANTLDPAGAPLAVLNFGQSAAPLAVIDLNNQQLPIETQIVSSPTAIAPGQYQITLPSYTEIIYFVESAGITFTSALDPTNPQPGEFVWNPANSLLIIYSTNALAGDLSITTNSFANPTDYVSPALFALFYGLPVVGKFSWGGQLHQHPSGSLNLFVLRSEISSIRSKFKKSSEIELAGIGFSVANYKEKLLSLKDYPSGCYEVSVSLTGKWELQKYNKPVFYKVPPPLPASTPYADPDCFLPTANAGSSGTGVIQQKVAITTLANRNTVNFIAVNTIGTDAWSVPIPFDAPANASTDWLKEASERAEEYGYFIDFNSPSAVRIRQINDVQAWSFSTPSIEVTCQGDTWHSGSNYFGYAAEYPNVKVDAIFSKSGIFTPEVTQGSQDLLTEPKWKQRTPKQVILESGSKDYAVPPEDLQFIKSTSQAWDNSGETKTRRRTVTEDGSPVSEEEWIYGLVFDSTQVPEVGNDALYAPTAPYWQICQYKITTYNYDPTTGYALGSDTTGYRWARFNEETDKLEARSLLGSSDPIDVQMLATYKFQKLPLTSNTRYILKQYRDFYSDFKDTQPPFAIYKHCFQDGTSQWLYKLDPTYAEPMFVAEEQTWTNSFANMPNPESDPNDLKPDLMTGEISSVEVRRQILPSQTTTSVVNGQQIGVQKLDSDRFIEWRTEDNAQGAEFRGKAVRESFEEHEGRPSPATRKPPLLEKEQPQAVPQLPNNSSHFEYRLTSVGYNPFADPVTETLSFKYLITPDQVLNSAKIRLKLKDIEESVDLKTTIPFNPQVRPLDRVSLVAGTDFYQARVVSFQNTVEIQGISEGYPLIVSGGTELNCGIDRDIPVALTKVPVAIASPPGFGSPIQLNPYYVNKTLGNPLIRQGKTRGNF